MFIDRLKESDIYKNCKVFLNKIKELKPYIVKFAENSAIKPKVYLLDYAVRNNYWQLIIVITYDKYTFFANNDIQKVWA